MTAPRQPTNLMILKEIQEVKAMQVELAHRMTEVEKYQLRQESYKEAYADIKTEERTDKSRKLKDREFRSKRDFYVQATALLTALGAALYAFLQTRSIH